MKALPLGQFDPPRAFYCRETGIDEESAVAIFERRDLDVMTWEQGHRLMHRYRAIVADGATPLIVDLGGHIGESAVWFSGAFPAAAIVSLEPDAGNAEVLRKNVEGLRVTVLERAVASRPGRVDLLDPGLDTWGYTTAALRHAPERVVGVVEAVTVDDVLAMAVGDGVEPFILKFNIEGAELELFSENTAWVDRFDLIVGELHDVILRGRAASRPFLKTIAARDRDFVHNDTYVFSFKNEAPE